MQIEGQEVSNSLRRSEPLYQTLVTTPSDRRDAQLGAEQVLNRVWSTDGHNASDAQVLAVMVTSVDGVIEVDGSSTALGGPADRAVLRGLRERADCILVGMGTLESERYATILDPDQQARRRLLGLKSTPDLVSISRAGDFDRSVPIFTDPTLHKVVYLETGSSDLDCRQLQDGVSFKEIEHPLTVKSVISDLQAAGYRRILCEGGPTLLRAAISADAVDQLMITFSPLLGLSGRQLLQPVFTETTNRESVLGSKPLTLLNVFTSGSMIFGHYVVGHHSSTVERT